MARPPAKPPPTPRRPAPAPRRSRAGGLAGAVIAVAAAGGVGTGLNLAGQHPAPSVVAAAACGGTERWNVKVATDPDSAALDPNPTAMTVGQMNAMLPGPL